MRETLSLIGAGCAGFALGAVFFAGLWWTVREGISSQRPGLIFFTSLFLRTGLVLAGFYLITRGHWERIPLWLLGFILARMIVTQGTDPCKSGPVREVSHAPYSR
jgi:F1F0 ATPase subunit 2